MDIEDSSSNHSQFVPETVRVEKKEASRKGNKKAYEIDALPSDAFEFRAVCRHKIGSSGAFCIAKKCTIAHKGEVL